MARHRALRILFLGWVFAGCAPDGGGGGAHDGDVPATDGGAPKADGNPTPPDEGADLAVGDDGVADAPLDAGRDAGAPLPDGAAPDAAFEVGEFVRVEPGVFAMGSPPDEPGRDLNAETQHEVTITRAFLIKATEVTQGEWRALMGGNPSHFQACGDTCPVEQVNWGDAVDYANALSDAQGLPRCYDEGREFAGLDCPGYRLPTEAEWEYAARAGTQTAFHTGDITQPDCDPVDPSLDRAGWYCGNAGGTTHPVAEKEPNAWGLYDVHGNVWEWVNDWYDSGYGGRNRAATDPIGPTRGRKRGHRGGSWDATAARARAARRVQTGVGPDLRIEYIGFRLARTAP